MNLTERIEFTWDYAGGTWSLKADAALVGFIRVTEGGGFQARFGQKWLSASRYVSYEPFETLKDAKQALLDAWLEKRA